MKIIVSSIDHSQLRKQKFYEDLKIATLAGLAIIIFIFLFIFSLVKVAKAETASWYSEVSCKREGTWQKYGGKMANGEVFDDKKMVCASWNFPFETKVKVTNLANGKTVIVVVKDRGPAKKLVRQGRIIDLSKSAFMKIASLRQGVIKVKVEKLQ